MEETQITFRIVLPKSLGCRFAEMEVFTENSEHKYISMDFECDDGYGEEWWKCTFTPEQSGLYFYFFRLKTDYSESKITKFEYSSGRISDEGECFFFTVYDKEFKTPDAIKGSLIYQIFPDRFSNSGTPKINVPDNRIIRNDWGEKPLWLPDEKGNIDKYDFFCGDLKGIEEKLEYLSSLGVGYIYLNPIFKANSNHRYDTGDYETIDPLLGTDDDFKSLISKALKYGINIIIDGVFSHTGSDSKYFNREGKYGKGGAYNDQKSPYFQWYKFKEYPDEYDCWWNVDILPEVDETNDSFIEYIGKVSDKWQNSGIAGWRLDVADELPDKFLDSLRERVKKNNPEALILGEVWEDASIKVSYGNRRRYLQGKQLDSVMNYPFADTMIDFAISGVAEGFNDKINSVCENYPKCVVDCLMNHIGTHDTCRIINRLGTLDSYYSDHINRYDGEMTEEEINRGIKLLKLISVVQYTLPGVPSVYYGDEVGTIGGVDPYNRGCFPWGKENKSLLEHYRLLGQIRKDHKVFVDGEFVPISSMLGCVCFIRRNKDEEIVTIANRNDHSIDYNLPYDGFTALTDVEISGRVVIVPEMTSVLLIRKIK